jgi:tRNA dimethylallyltransferase
MIVAIVGPTAAGKTALALRVAESLGAEIVSCDSMQIYRGFDIGTAKPTAEERARVRHHVVDIAGAEEAYSAARYVAEADRAIADITARKRRVVICGGTGLYLRALRFGLVDAPPRDEELRKRLYDEEAARPGILHVKLRSVDPETAARLPSRDLIRIVRALEVHELTGEPLGKLHAQHARTPRHAMRVLVLDPPMDQLMARITVRAEIMLGGGLIDETRRLVDRHGRDARPLHSVGYAEVLQYLDKRLTAAQLGPAIVQSTRKYARRQRVWFKKEPEARFFSDVERLVADAVAEER